MGHLSYACFGYADDVNLLAPSVGALQELISICEGFAEEYNVTFNEKTRMRIGGKGTAPGRCVTMKGVPIEWKTKIRHLGNIITYDLCDYHDIKFKKGVFISQVNKLNAKFPFVSSVVKGHLLQTYCCAWYGSQTWDLVGNGVNKMNVEWNKAVRRTLNLPYCTHRRLLPLIVNGKSFINQHFNRIEKYINEFRSSNNDHISFIAETAKMRVTGPLGRNWARLYAKDDLVPSNLKMRILLQTPI